MVEDIRPHIRSAALKALVDYWHSKKHGERLPARRDIDPWEMRSFLPQIFLVTVTQNPMRFWFRLVGTGIEAGYGEGIAGRYLDEIELDNVQKDIHDQYEMAVREAQPVYSRCDYIKDDKTRLRYERLLLPLSSDGKIVDMLLGGAAPIGDRD